MPGGRADRPGQAVGLVERVEVRAEVVHPGSDAWTLADGGEQVPHVVRRLSAVKEQVGRLGGASARAVARLIPEVAP